jgi:3-keto-disaccharide hydrolase
VRGALALAAILLLPEGGPADPVPPDAAVDPGPPGTPPSDAVVLFDGKDLSRWRSRNGEPGWEVKDGVLTVAPGKGDLITRDAFGDIQLHLEWRIPAGVTGEGESRGNSGIKLHEAYEIQILDSYGKTEKPLTAAGALYKQAAPLVNVCRKPGEWQVFDIVFRAPRFDGGALKKHGTVTVFHNGVLIHDRATIQGRTNSTQPVKPDLEQPFFLQDHGSPVSFRNIWVRKLAPLL